MKTAEGNLKTVATEAGAGASPLLVLHKVAEIDLGGREVTAYYRLTGPRGPRILHDLAEAEDAFDREAERLVPVVAWSPRARVA